MTNWTKWVTAAWNVICGTHVPYYRSGPGYSYKQRYIAEHATHLSQGAMTKLDFVRGLRDAPAGLPDNRSADPRQLLARVEQYYEDLTGETSGDASGEGFLKRYGKILALVGGGTAAAVIGGVAWNHVKNKEA